MFAGWASSFSACLRSLWCWRVHAVQVPFESVHVGGPKTAVILDPTGRLLERGGFQAAGAPLRLAAADDETGALQDFEVLGDGGHGHLERLGEFSDGGFAKRQPSQDGAASGIGEGGEGGGEVILHLL